MFLGVFFNDDFFPHHPCYGLLNTLKPPASEWWWLAVSLMLVLPDDDPIDWLIIKYVSNVWSNHHRFGGFHKWEIPNRWLVYNRKYMKIPLKWMIWGYPYFRKPPVGLSYGPSFLHPTAVKIRFVCPIFKHTAVHPTNALNKILGGGSFF